VSSQSKMVTLEPDANTIPSWAMMRIK
jgi:hypothetical protein